MIVLFEHTGWLAWNDKKVDLNSRQPKRQNHASGFKSCFFFCIDRFEFYVCSHVVYTNTIIHFSVHESGRYMNLSQDFAL